MNQSPSDSTPHSSDLALRLVKQGMLGLPIAEQIGGFCRTLYDLGVPMKRVQMGMYTLHPRYGSHTFVWRPDADKVEHVPRSRAIVNDDIYLKSPVHHMRSRGIQALHRRLDTNDPDEFIVFEELRGEGLTDYAAFVVPYDPAQVEAIARDFEATGNPASPGLEADGIFFSCATDRAEGFGDGQLKLVADLLPYLALSLKSRLTYDVASTVLETYLGRDAGQRVLTGEIERGSAEAIRAVIWFADLRGFTSLTDGLPRDVLVATLDDYLEAMAAPVHSKNGQILKFMGEGLLATFDLTGRDAATVCREALAAAAELHADFPALNEERKAAGKPVMEFGLALHLGEVFYGNIGASERLDFTVIGPAVNEASRIQALCRPLERDILVSSTFRETAGSERGLISLGSHELRGVREPQELFGLAD